MNNPNVTDWFVAIASVFAAAGTVGAVVVALGQIGRQQRRKLSVHASSAIIGADENIDVLSLRGINDGFRPIKVTMAYLMTEDGRQVVGRLLPYSDDLPKVLLDGESVEVYWRKDLLDELKQREGFAHYLYAFFMDAAGNVYAGAYPGVERRRAGPPWKRRDRWEPGPHAEDG